MTAHVDLLVLRKKIATDDCYEPWWLLADYADTSGLWRGRDKKFDHFEVKGKGIIIDALWGDGPSRYGFSSVRPVELVDYDYARNSIATTIEEFTGKYIVERTLVMNVLQNARGAGGGSLQALLLSEFTKLLRTIPVEDMESCRGTTVPMSAFLEALPSSCIIIPHIGMNIAYDIESLRRVCGHRSGIVPARYLE